MLLGKEVQAFLREHDLTLFVERRERRYLCTLQYKDGKTKSMTSRGSIPEGIKTVMRHAVLKREPNVRNKVQPKIPIA